MEDVDDIIHCKWQTEGIHSQDYTSVYVCVCVFLFVYEHVYSKNLSAAQGKI